MASVEDAMYSFLAATTAVTAVVGSRVEPIQFAQSTALPRVLVTKTMDVPVMACGGATGAWRSTFTLESQARDVATAESARNAVRTAVNGIRGTFGGVFATRVAVVGESDLAYPPAAGEETVVVAKSLDVEINYVP